MVGLHVPARVLVAAGAPRHLHVGGMVLFEVPRATGDWQVLQTLVGEQVWWGQGPSECPHFPQVTQMSSHRRGPNSGQPSVLWGRGPMCVPTLSQATHVTLQVGSYFGEVPMDVPTQ